MLLAGAVLAGAALPGAAGCSSAGPAGAAPGTACGQTRTGVNVPVVIEVARGPVSCAAALRIERAYAAAIRSGELRGNGGGAPLTVDGWTCQTYPTEKVLRTGDASECHTGSAEVVAVLTGSSPSPASSAPVQD